MDDMMWIVPVGVGTIALVAALVIATAGRMCWPYVVVALVVTGSAGILQGSIGPWIHRKLTELDQMAAPHIGEYTGVAVTLTAAVAVIGFWAFWVRYKQIDLRALGFSAVVPIAVTLIPGAFGTFLMFVVGLIPAVTGGLIGLALFGSWGG